MKRFLILGGTRFAGKALVEDLVSDGYDVTVLSRNPTGCPAGAKQIIEEREKGLKKIQGSSFEVCFDFIGYNAQAPIEVCESINIKVYVLISTTWLPYYFSITADKPVSGIERFHGKHILNETKNYLKGKAVAEQSVNKLRKRKIDATSVRIPIMLGRNDHTDRLNFYRARLADGAGVILVNRGQNQVQVVWHRDVAKVLKEWILMSDPAERSVWELLPLKSLSVREFITELGYSNGYPLKFFSANYIKIDKHVDGYLDLEPLWRERNQNVTKANLFYHANLDPTPFSHWFKTLESVPEISDKFLRRRECDFIRLLSS
tara:strand:- start:458 stop:1411 length:954 start_codon:yes stop_codon:yes gene_type:complete